MFLVHKNIMINLSIFLWLLTYCSSIFSEIEQNVCNNATFVENETLEISGSVQDTSNNIEPFETRCFNVGVADEIVCLNPAQSFRDRVNNGVSIGVHKLNYYQIYGCHLIDENTQCFASETNDVVATTFENLIESETYCFQTGQNNMPRNANLRIKNIMISYCGVLPVELQYFNIDHSLSRFRFFHYSTHLQCFKLATLHSTWRNFNGLSRVLL